MSELYAQGDILIERVGDIPVSGERMCPEPDGAYVLAEGEQTGHRHAIYEHVAFFRDDGLARDMPKDLYVGHLKVTDTTARLVHEEHAPVVLPRGTYRIRRQRELDPEGARLVAD